CYHCRDQDSNLGYCGHNLESLSSRDRLVVRTLRCGRNNPGSNPGHGSAYAKNKIPVERPHLFYRYQNVYSLRIAVVGRNIQKLLKKFMRTGSVADEQLFHNLSG
ncbi:hypothetical protein L9F63_010215, partial [Diploptera punctata]